MFSSGALGVDPQEPSTSTGPQRRREDNLRNFNEMFSKPHETTLWHVCTAHQRNPRARMRYRLEIQDLEAVDFKALLYDHRYELNSLAKASGTNFKELFESLRFFAKFRKIPFFKNPDAFEFFKLVCNCIFHVNDRWVNGLNKDNLLNPASLQIVMQDMKLYSDYDLLDPVSRLQDREKVPIPPPPTPQVTPQYNILQDEYIRDMHSNNFLRVYDLKFNSIFEKAMNLKNLDSVSNRVAKRFSGYEDYDYFQDNSKLPGSRLSFRLTSVAQILDFALPLHKSDGYFPRNCQNRPQYLFERYEEANKNCKECFAKIRDLRPIKPGFKEGCLTPKECYEYHLEGRHIHGFFDVWEEEGRGWKNPVDGQWVPRRYLVDIYHQFMFPLHAKRRSWPGSLLWAFDKYICYGMKLWHMTRECSTQLKNAGAALFAPYSQNVLDCDKLNLYSEKGRASLWQSIIAENSLVAEQFARPLLDAAREVQESPAKQGRKRKGNPKLEEAEAMASPAKQQRTPRKVSESVKLSFSSSGPIVPLGLIQKENVERPQVATVVPATSFSYQQTPPSAVKRRVTEAEANSSVTANQPKRKMSVSLEKWEGQTGCARGPIQEEHIDERNEEFLDLQGGNVWVPQDRGDGVEPEVYAREILEHYQGQPNGDRPATPPPQVKPARRRKTTPKNVPGSPDRTPQPVLYSKPTSSTSSTTSSAPSTSENPPGKTTSNSKMRLLYSIKNNPPKNASSSYHLNNKYPVKQLSPGAPPAPTVGPIVNGTTRYPTVPQATGAPSIGARISPYGGQQRAPYYASQQMRRAVQQTHHPVMHQHQRFANGTPPGPSSSAPTLLTPPPQPPHRMLLHPQGPAMYRVTGAVPGAPPAQKEPKDSTTPAKRAIANHSHQPTDTCRRVLPFRVVMEHKPNHPWTRKNHPENRLTVPALEAPPQQVPVAVAPPLAPPAPSAPKTPSVIRRASGGTQRVDFRQRSISNAARPNGTVPPIAHPTAWPQSPAAPAKKSRPMLPQPTGSLMVNSPIRLPMAPAMVNQAAPPVTGPMLHRTVASPSRPMTIAARVVPTMPAPAAVMVPTTTGPPSRMAMPSVSSPAPTGVPSDQQQMSIKELSTAIRKKCKTLTPEQHGDALRTHSRRFQVDNHGSTAPSPPQPTPFVNFLSDNL